MGLGDFVYPVFVVTKSNLVAAVCGGTRRYRYVTRRYAAVTAAGRGKDVACQKYDAALPILDAALPHSARRRP
jgi:hypothetical protein